MTPDQKTAYVQAMTAAMLAELESMRVANLEREREGKAYAYDEKAFADLPVRFGLTHNAIISFFHS